MRTVLLLGLAAGTLLLAGRANAEPAPAPKLEYGAPTAPDVRVYTGSPDRVPSEVDYRRVSGAYEADGRWTGTWDGTYEAPDGGRYEGRYEGSVEGPGAGYPPPPEYGAPYGYDPRDAEMAHRCGPDGGGDGKVGGAVVGAVVGGVVGNQVAGKGDRTAGTLIGGGVGALAGSAIGGEIDRKKCDEYWAGRKRHHGGGHHGYSYGYGYGHPGTTVYQHGGYGYSSYGYGYGWYSPGVVVVTTITTPAITETVETTTKTYYENAPVRKRYAPKKKWKPRPKPRCAC